MEDNNQSTLFDVIKQNELETGGCIPHEINLKHMQSLATLHRDEGI